MAVVFLTAAAPASRAACPDFASAVGYTAGPGSHPRKIVTADFNGDGRPDLAVTTPEIDKIGIFLADGPGTFAAVAGYAVGDYPYAIATGDFDRDGVPDLVVANGSVDTLAILIGNGSGGFTTLASYLTDGFTHEIAVGDLNGDGAADIATATVTASIEVSIDPVTAFDVFTTDIDSWWQRGPSRLRRVARRTISLPGS